MSGDDRTNTWAQQNGMTQTNQRFRGAIDLVPSTVSVLTLNVQHCTQRSYVMTVKTKEKGDGSCKELYAPRYKT